jgi:hypothetical protein
MESGRASQGECANCGRSLRNDAEWLWWRAIRDDADDLVLFCGECFDEPSTKGDVDLTD